MVPSVQQVKVFANGVKFVLTRAKTSKPMNLDTNI